MKTGNGRSLTMLCANKSVYHAQTHTFTISPEFEEWETKDTAGKEFELKNLAFSASADGIVCVRDTSESGDNLDTPDMIAQTISGQAVDVVVELALPGTTAKKYTTKCVVESFEVSEAVSEKATYKASFKGYGLSLME